MSNRVVGDDTFLDVFGRPVQYASEDSFHDKIPHPSEWEPPASTWRTHTSLTCRSACTWQHDYMAQAVVRLAARLTTLAVLRGSVPLILPCCHALLLCGHCIRPVADHVDGKCIYAAARADYTLSHMDVYNSDWRSQWWGDLA